MLSWVRSAGASASLGSLDGVLGMGFEVGGDGHSFREWRSCSSVVSGRDSAGQRRRPGEERPHDLSDDFCRVAFDDSTAKHREVAADVDDRVRLSENVCPFEMVPPVRHLISGEGATSPISFGPICSAPFR